MNNIKYIDTLPIPAVTYYPYNMAYTLNTIFYHRCASIEWDGLCLIFNEHHLTSQERKEWKELVSADFKTFKHMEEASLDFMWGGFDIDVFFVAMPRDVWMRFERKLSEKVKFAKRNTVARVYLYLYHYAMRHQGSYSHSRDNLTNILQMDKTNFAHSIKWLEENEFIVVGDYSKKEGYARRYYIPESDWTYQCRKEFAKNQEKISRRGIE